MAEILNEINMDEKVRQMCIQLRPQIEARTNRKFATFIPLLYANLFVNGVIYWVKILVEPAVNNMLNECIHVHVYDAHGVVHLQNVEQERTVLDPFSHHVDLKQ